MKFYSICKRRCISKKESPKHVGRIITECFIIDEKKNIVAVGRTVFNPTIDTDDKKLGYGIALNVAKDGLKKAIEYKIVRLCSSQISRFHGMPPWVVDFTGMLVFNNKVMERIEKMDLRFRKPVELN